MTLFCVYLSLLLATCWQDDVMVCVCVCQVCGSGSEEREASPTWTLFRLHSLLQWHRRIYDHLSSQWTHRGKNWRRNIWRSTCHTIQLTLSVYVCAGSRPAQWPVHHVWCHHSDSWRLQGKNQSPDRTPVWNHRQPLSLSSPVCLLTCLSLLTFLTPHLSIWVSSPVCPSLLTCLSVCLSCSLLMFKYFKRCVCVFAGRDHRRRLYGGVRCPQQKWDSTRGWSCQHVTGHPSLYSSF